MKTISLITLFFLTTFLPATSFAQDAPVHDDNPKIELEIKSVTDLFCVGEDCDWKVECAAAPVGATTSPDLQPRRHIFEADDVASRSIIDLHDDSYVPFSGRPLPNNVFSVADLPLNLTCRVEEEDGGLRGGGISEIKMIRIDRCNNLPTLSVEDRDEGGLRINYNVRARPRLLTLWYSEARGDFQTNTSTINSNHTAQLEEFGFIFKRRLGWISHPNCINFGDEQPLYNWFNPERGDNVAAVSTGSEPGDNNWDPAAYPNNRKTMSDGSTYQFVDVLGGLIKNTDANPYVSRSSYPEVWLWHSTENSVPLNRRDYALIAGRGGNIGPTPDDAPRPYVRVNILQGRILSPSLSLENAVRMPPFSN